jgi:hypothetical protein
VLLLALKQTKAGIDMKFLDINAARNFSQQAMNHYVECKAPVWFTDWLDDLYIRLGENWRNITVDELATLAELGDYGPEYPEYWLMQSLAVNIVYKLFDRLGRDTTGIAGY